MQLENNTYAGEKKDPLEAVTFEKLGGDSSGMNKPEMEQRQSYLNLIRGMNKPGAQVNDKSPTSRYLSQNGFAN